MPTNAAKMISGNSHAEQGGEEGPAERFQRAGRLQGYDSQDKRHQYGWVSHLANDDSGGRWVVDKPLKVGMRSSHPSRLREGNPSGSDEAGGRL